MATKLGRRQQQMAAATPAQPITVRYDADSIARMALKVKAEGFVPAHVLRGEFGPEKSTQGVAVLFRDFRMFREVRRPWTGGEAVLGYEWADRRFSKSEVKKIPPALGFIVDLAQDHRPRYGQFERVSVRCRWVNAILGSVPVKDAGGDPTNTFERDLEGNVEILRYHQRAMAHVALPMIGKEASIARHIGWSIIRVPPDVPVKIIEHGIVELGRPGGKGLRRSERIADGTEFIIRAMVPTTELSVAEFLEMLRCAGQFVGLSPGRSAGFGDFEVLGAE
jgi:hypothetical protein